MVTPRRGEPEEGGEGEVGPEGSKTLKRKQTELDSDGDEEEVILLEEKRVRGEMPGKTPHDAAAEAQRRRYQQTSGVPNNIPPPGAKPTTTEGAAQGEKENCLLYTSPSPRDS